MKELKICPQSHKCNFMKCEHRKPHECDDGFKCAIPIPGDAMSAATQYWFGCKPVQKKSRCAYRLVRKGLFSDPICKNKNVKDVYCLGTKWCKFFLEK